MAWQWHKLRNRRLTTMKTGIEASHLRHVGQTIHRGLDSGEVVRLMKWREWNQFAQVVQHCWSQFGWSFEPCTSVDHAMSNAENPRATVFRFQPGSERIHRLSSITN